jgi:hypothetical protein
LKYYLSRPFGAHCAMSTRFLQYLKRRFQIAIFRGFMSPCGAILRQLCIILTLVSAVAIARADQPVSPSVPTAPTFTFEDLMKLINTKHITSIDNLIPELPEALRHSYTLMRKTGSLQDASREAPRAILFGKDAKLILTFNGEPAQLGYDELEVIQFRDQTKEFEFRDINFAGGRLVVSKPNPIDCVSCHSGLNTNLGLRPNWMPYNQWFGAFGEHDDVPSDADKAALIKVAKLPRYSALDHPNDIYPFSNSEFDNLNLRPNWRLSELLNRLQAQHLAHIIESPAYAPFKGAVLFTAANCAPSGADSELIAQIIRKHSANRYNYSRQNEAYADFTKLLPAIGISSSDWSMAPDKYNQSMPSSPSPYNYVSGYNTTSQFVAYQLATHIAAQDADFAAQFDTSISTLGDGAKYNSEYGGQNALIADEDVALLNGLGKSLTDDGDYEHSEGARVSDKNCKLFSQYMRDHTPSDLNANETPSPLYIYRSASEMNTLMARKCSVCHNGVMAPYIPFGDKAAFKKSLSDTGYAHGTLADEILFRMSSDDAKVLAMPRLAPNIEDTAILRKQISTYIMGQKVK